MSRNLNEILTNWEELLNAYASESSGDSAILAKILQRYIVAVAKYLHSIVKDTHVAEDLTQEFAVRFLRGDFNNLHPNKGRFRDFLKVVLRNMVIDHFRKQKHSLLDSNLLVSQSFHEESVAEQYDRIFIAHWREDLLRRAWLVFENTACRKSSLYYHALRLFTESGGMRSDELARRLSEIRGQTINAVAARQTLRRARQLFADCLREEVRQSLSTTENQIEAVEEELCELRLTKYLDAYPAKQTP